jgi:hypothetical protein
LLLNGFDVDTANGIRNLELRIGDLPALGLDACGERLTLAPERLELEVRQDPAMVELVSRASHRLVTSSNPAPTEPDGDSAEPPLPPDLPSTPRPWPGLDRLGVTQAIGGLALGLIALFTSYDHITVAGTSIQLQQQWGIVCIAASVATVVVDAQLASRSRLRESHERKVDRDRTDQERHRADQERNRAAEAREQTAVRAQLQARYLVAQSRFLLLDTPRNRRQLSEAVALLMEQLQPG